MTKETAMKILKELHNKSLFAERTALETLIPELAVSEDERIKKDIIRILKGELNYTSKEDANKYIAWLEKQGEQKPILDFKASNWYVSKVDGKIHDMTYNPTDKVEPFDKYKGLTDFERTLADICIGWIGEEIGWKDYIIKNSLPLLEIAKRQLLQQGELIQPVF